MDDTSKKSEPAVRRVVWGRQFLASTVVVPPDVAEHLNTDAMAVLAVIRNEAQASGKCSLPLARIAERANIGRAKARAAIRLAEGYGSAQRFGSLVIARIVLMTSASGSSPSGARTTIERAVGGRDARSSMSIGLPDRQTILVRPVSPTRARISSSISTLSRSARITIARVRLVRVRGHDLGEDREDRGDQPRITVWSRSTTRDRPLRSSASLPAARC